MAAVAEQSPGDLARIFPLFAEAVEGHLQHGGPWTRVVPGMLIELRRAVDRDVKRRGVDAIFVHQTRAWHCETLESLRRFFRMDDPMLPALDASIAAARDAFNRDAWLKVNEAKHRERRGLQ